MMTKTEQLSNLIESHGGYLPLIEARELGISQTYMYEYIEKNGFERISCGLYKAPDAWDDALYVLALNNRKAIFSFDTALMLHGLTEREPSDIFVTLPRTYNASHLRKNGINVFQVKKEWTELGKTTAKTVYGNEVPAYDMERTICDIIRFREKKDPQMFSYALKEFAKRKDKNLHRLISYALEFGIEDEVRRYMEVLL